MKLITRDTDYAVRALCVIARHKQGLISVSELVALTEIPRPFLRKILQILNKKRILISYKGKGGGFRLARAPQKIYLLDLIRIFQGPLKLNECIFKKAPCPDIKICKLRKKLEKIQKNVISDLRHVTVRFLLSDGDRK